LWGRIPAKKDWWTVAEDGALDRFLMELGKAGLVEGPGELAMLW